MNLTMHRFGGIFRQSISISLLLAIAPGTGGCQSRAGGQDAGGDDGGIDADLSLPDSETGELDATAGDGHAADAEPDGPAREPTWPEPWDFDEGLGEVEEIPTELQPLFVSTDVPALPEPGPNDWLANFDEPGQTYEEFLRMDPILPTASRRTLYIQPLGESGQFTEPTLDELEQFYAAYFSMNVETLDPIEPTDFEITERRNPTEGQRQLLTTDILSLLRSRMPEDAYSLIAVTVIDLYPADDWNFVFGQASIVYGVGVFSFARYAAPERPWALSRAFKVLAHESGHMFGIYHCTHFHCLMNGSNHLFEMDSAPIHACPIDLRKLYFSIGFDPVDRYRNLALVYEGFGMIDEAAWIDERLLRSGF